MNPDDLRDLQRALASHHGCRVTHTDLALAMRSSRRSVAAWMSGEVAIPGPASALLRLLRRHPELLVEMLADADPTSRPHVPAQP